MENINWHWFTFDEMITSTLYDYLHLRQQVFIVEQACIYSDLDDKDQVAHHLLGFTPAGNLVAGLRLLPPQIRYQEPSLGRVVVAANARKQGVGHTMIEEGLRYAREIFPTQSIRVQAQAHLKDFYAHHGFEQQGEAYDEDGIPHIDMLTTS